MLILELMIRGWSKKYEEILQDFGYKKQNDLRSAYLLDSLICKQYSFLKLERMISGKRVFVIGSGPTLGRAIPFLKKYKNIVKICADTALDVLIKNGIKPQIIITDLDGNLSLIQKLSSSSVIIVHAHGDNISRLEFIKNFKNCLGTTQTRKIGKIENFGGFTDGDRAVFFASRFNAKKIFLFGMDFGSKIGIYSRTKKTERKIKRRKLVHAKKLLEWLSSNTKSDLFTLSMPIRGFRKITYKQLEVNVKS